MNRRLAPAIVLAFLAAAFGELLSGSSPPLAFFSPITLLSLLLFYGGGAILVRELALRWGGTSRATRWMVILLLGAAYGIVEEGLVTKSFFDPMFADAGVLTHYGRWLGVNWLWTIDLTLFHMLVSIAAPIIVTEVLFAQRRDEPWVRRRGTTAIAIIFLSLSALMFFTLSLYRPPVAQYVIAAGVAAGLVVFGRVMGRRPHSPSAATVASPRRIAVVGFTLACLVWLLLMFIAQAISVPVLATLALTLVIAGLGLRWLVRAVVSAEWTDEHAVAFVSGVTLFWAGIAVLDEFSGLAGMSIVAATTIVGLVRLRRRVHITTQGKAVEVAESP